MSPSHTARPLLERLQRFLRALLSGEAAPFIVSVLGGPSGVGHIALGLPQPVAMSLWHVCLLYPPSSQMTPILYA